MTRIIYLPILTLAILFVFSPAMANDKKELRKQRQVAQKERQAQKRERSDNLKESLRDFREFTREQIEDYQLQAEELTTEFELRSVELKAEHDIKVAGAEAEYQKKLSGLFATPGMEFDSQTLKRLKTESKAYADELFTLKKQSAEKLHKERIANKKSKNILLAEGDLKAMDKAAELGLTKDYPPILAVKIGDGLTKKEQRWNTKEKKEVLKIKEKNRKAVSKFRNGERIRNWEIQNSNIDFKLTWDEKAEIHKLDSTQLFYNVLLMQSGKVNFDQQSFMSEMADINSKKKLINIKYKKIRDKNRITRKNEKKDILNH